LCVVIAKKSAINLQAALILVVENTRMDNFSYQTKPLGSQQFAQNEKTSLLKQTQLTSSATEDDLRKISSLDWLLIDEESPQYMELLWQATALIRSFLLDQKLEQARETFNKMSGDIIELAYREFNVKRTLPDGTNCLLAFDMANVFREYFCHKSFFEANEAFQKWLVN